MTPVMESSIPHTSETGPPFCNPGVKPLARRQHHPTQSPSVGANSHLAIDSHEASKVMDRARMDREPKLRLNTACSAVNLVGAK